MTVPVELYRIAIDAAVYTLTSGDAPVDYGGETYTPAPVGRSAVEQGAEINRANIQIHLPRTTAIAQLYLTAVPDYPASVTIYRQQGASTAVYWKGRVAGASATGSEVTLDCESVFTSLRRPGLRARYQPGCRHAHYHRGCGLDLENWISPATCTAVAGTTVTVPEAAAQPDGWWLGGQLRTVPDGVLRSIIGHTGDQLTLQRTAEPLAEQLVEPKGWDLAWDGYWDGKVGVEIAPGCDRSKEMCADKFANVLNHGGFPWIPSKNPLGGSSIV